MSVIAMAVKHLIAAGVSGDDLVSAIADMEAEMQESEPARSSAAERQARYRARKKEEETVTRDVTLRNSVTNVTQKEEKEKRIKKEKEEPPSPKENPPKGGQKKGGFPLPEGLDPEIWEEFRKHRREKRAVLTPTAEKRALAKLERMRASGTDPTEAVRQSLENGWTGIFEPKEKANGTNRPTRTQDLARQASELLEQYRD